MKSPPNKGVRKSLEGAILIQSKPNKTLIIDESLRNRFWGRVSIRGSDECWEHAGRKTRNGHSLLHVGFVESGKTNMEYAHRVSVLLSGRDLPMGCEVCHSCNNPGCVNPKHLYVGDRNTNAKDMVKCGSQKGENNPACKLSENQCVSIRWLRSQGFLLRDIAFMFNCRESTVSRIASGVRRKVPMVKGGRL